MTDIVDRLRDLAAIDNCQTSIEAADEITRLRAENERLRAALREIADSDYASYGIRRIARAALDGQPAPSGWRPDALVTAANAIIDFYNGPAEAKRPDIFQRLMQRLANALPPAPGKEGA